ncbi:MAG TPA: rhamnogalacturonan lyase, partial [Bacillota bacterium]|nr:rhamnogalacturonan lyase [Bacillota bacterium]
MGLLILVLAATLSYQPVDAVASGRQMERLDRGVVAVKLGKGNFISWRIFGTEAENVSFNLYRDGDKVNESPLTVSNYLDKQGKVNATYTIAAVINGKEQTQSDPVKVWNKNYLSVPLQKPKNGKTIHGTVYTYSANDCSVGDLDGDHQYEIVVKWDPSNSQDNSRLGCTGEVYLDAYKMDGTMLWRINLGTNIRAGAHYTQFSVYDLDGDGKAEVACRTADGTIDGAGKVIGDPQKDYRDLDKKSPSYGCIVSGPEYYTVFNGRTGAAMDTVNFEPARGNPTDWGDNEGNRVDRFLAGVAYVDGEHPSLITARGYYLGVMDGVTKGKTGVVAWDFKNGKLVKRWSFEAV